MLRRRRPRVLAELAARSSSAARPGSLNRAELEQLRSLLGALDEARVVLITGGGPRAAVALDLATAAAVAGGRTALLEGDLARPVLASALALSPSPGLAEYLRFEADAQQILQQLVLAGPASAGAGEPLVCVVGGAPSSDAPALLGSPGFAHAVRRLRSAYELVVVSGPAGSEPDSVGAIAPHADSVIACRARSERSSAVPAGVDGFVIVG